MYVTTREGNTVFTYDDGRICLALDRKRNDIDLKRRMSFDEVKDLVDSAFAVRVIEALQKKLDPVELDRVLKILTDADVIRRHEREAVNEQMNAEAEEAPSKEEMATDAAMFPHQNRLGPPMAVARPHYSSLVVQMTAAESRQHDEMFPHAGRLKK